MQVKNAFVRFEPFPEFLDEEIFAQIFRFFEGCRRRFPDLQKIADFSFVEKFEKGTAFVPIAAVREKTAYADQCVGFLELIDRRRFSRGRRGFCDLFIHGLVRGEITALELDYVNGAPAAFFGVDLNAYFSDRRVEARFSLRVVENAPDRFARFRIVIVKLFTGQLVFHHIKGGQEDFELILSNQIQFQNSSPSENHIHLLFHYTPIRAKKPYANFWYSVGEHRGMKEKMTEIYTVLPKIPFATHFSGIFQNRSSVRGEYAFFSRNQCFFRIPLEQAENM